MFTCAKASIKMNFDWKIEGDAKYDEEDDARPTSYKYPRPKIDHLDVPASLDPKCLEEMYDVHKEARAGWSKYVDDYCSDNEDDPNGGRISPCTFARWAEGAGEKKYNNKVGDRFKSVMEEPREFEIPVSLSVVTTASYVFSHLWDDVHTYHDNRSTASAPSLPTPLGLAPASTVTIWLSRTRMMVTTCRPSAASTPTPSRPSSGPLLVSAPSNNHQPAWAV